MGEAMKYFLKKLLGHEIFKSMVSWATKIFLKNFKNPPAPPPTYLMYAPLCVVKVNDDVVAKKSYIFSQSNLLKFLPALFQSS